MLASLHVGIDQAWSAFSLVRAASAEFVLYAGNINSLQRMKNE
jgi:hypothetical protein